MKYMTLGQAFKFYCFQPESVRNDVAKTFSTLYANCHAKPILITQRRLRLAYDHIKDFRNICAHDERLYCARVAPSLDTAIGDVVKDLQLVLSKAEYVNFLTEYLRMMPALAMRDTEINVNDRICQFRIQKHQPVIRFEETDTLGNENRGGIGSTGRA